MTTRSPPPQGFLKLNYQEVNQSYGQNYLDFRNGISTGIVL